jgi:glutamate synthase domain-containing protein 2
MTLAILLAAIVVGLVALTLYDLAQRQHAILHNFPVVGHLRYLLESIGPELRQYIVTGNDEERPFSRDERAWIYTSSKQRNNYFGFGTDNDLEVAPNYLIIKHRTLALPPPAGFEGPEHDFPIPSAKLLGGHRGRRHAFRPASVVNISGMSFGALSATAVEAINRGAGIAGCLQNTGEGGITSYHRHGGELIWQIGTGYFGCRDARGQFSLERFKETLASAPVRAIEIKLSQGAKPGVGGLLPGAKVTDEIAAIRGVPAGVDCRSPSTHSAFRDPDSLLDFAELLAAETGLPVGIKSAVGELDFWRDLAQLMDGTGRGVDFITIDGGEGGTGAGPLVFTDHVALPFKLGFARVYRVFAEHGIHEDVVFIGSGKLGFPSSALFAFGLGCDMVNVGREVMMSIGCIQAQRCHTGHCPTGIATQSRWLMRGLDPTAKSARLANYLVSLRKELLALSHACGVPHPGLVTPDHFEIIDDRFGARRLVEVFDYEPGWGLPAAVEQVEIARIMGAAAEVVA